MTNGNALFPLFYPARVAYPLERWTGVMPLVFEWDPRKAQHNLRKHGVSFAEAASVFSDPLARIFVDEDHSAEERREIIIGHSKRLLVVCFTQRAKDRVRIISARCATKGEQRDYEEHVIG